MAVTIISVGLFLIINACILPTLMLVGIIAGIAIILGFMGAIPKQDYGFVNIMGLGSFYYTKY